MGITGGLVRSVFSKNNMRNCAVEKRRCGSVRLYLCGDRVDSVLAEEDSASVRNSEVTVTQLTVESSEGTIIQSPLESSETTVTQPVPEEFSDREEHIQSKEEHNSTAGLFLQEEAASVIQTAFRGYLARGRNGGIKSIDGKQELVVGAASPSRESPGTSLGVQTGNSTEVFSTREEITAAHHRLQQKARSPALRLKDDWDDSTVSSNITKRRIQHRLEATTRRERALAYAFSQQLRICSRKKQSRSDGTETNSGWNWLERWMATRLPESSTFESYALNQLESISINRRSVIGKRLPETAGEEKESCGSNEVSVQIDGISVSPRKPKDDPKLTKNRLKEATRSISRRKTVPSYNCPKQHSKAIKKDCPREDEKDEKHKQKQARNKSEIKCKDAMSLLSPDLVTSNNSKLEN